MASSSSSSSGAALSSEEVKAMSEGIDLIFGFWAAVRNWWGGCDSQAKADQLAASVLAWFTHGGARGGGRLDQDELEDLLHDAMDESFNTELEDGSVEEIVKHLMILHTRNLKQKYTYIDKLRKTRFAGSAITRSKKIRPTYHGIGNDISDDDEAGPIEQAEAPPAPRNPTRPAKPVPDEDGWTAVPPRRQRK
ncbi:hypothetical protein EJB05_00196, partial [Eragrostis curvula]